MKLIKGFLISVLVLIIIAYAAVLMIKNGKTSRGPVITSTLSQISVPCEYTKEDLLKELTAYDREEGDLTKEIVVRNFSEFTERGTAELEYAVFDSSKNIGTYKRKVTFIDYQPPQILVRKPIIFTEGEVSDFSLQEYLVGYDSLDGDISKHLKIEKSDVNFFEPGKYTISVSLENSFGDAVAMDLPVHILENKSRMLDIVLKTVTAYAAPGTDIHPNDYIERVWSKAENKNLPLDKLDVKTISGVDSQTPGVYEVYYNIHTEDGMFYGETWLIVIIGDYGG